MAPLAAAMADKNVCPTEEVGKQVCPTWTAVDIVIRDGRVAMKNEPGGIEIVYSGPDGCSVARRRARIWDSEVAR